MYAMLCSPSASHNHEGRESSATTALVYHAVDSGVAGTGATGCGFPALRTGRNGGACISFTVNGLPYTLVEACEG